MAASHLAEIIQIMKTCCPLQWQFKFRLLQPWPQTFGTTINFDLMIPHVSPVLNDRDWIGRFQASIPRTQRCSGRFATWETNLPCYCCAIGQTCENLVAGVGKTKLNHTGATTAAITDIELNMQVVDSETTRKWFGCVFTTSLAKTTACDVECRPQQAAKTCPVWPETCFDCLHLQQQLPMKVGPSNSKNLGLHHPTMFLGGSVRPFGCHSTTCLIHWLSGSDAK